MAVTLQRPAAGLAALGALLLVVAQGAAQGAEPAPCAQLADLSWLAGTWRAETRDSLVTETWTIVSNGTYEGSGVTRARADGSLQDSEELRLLAMGGHVFYVAKVAHNERPVAFRLTSCDAGRFVFENPAHDFPRRIEYRRVDDARFEAHVSDGGRRGIQLVFSRSPAG
jgi:hypothetical protein